MIMGKNKFFNKRTSPLARTEQELAEEYITSIIEHTTRLNFAIVLRTLVMVFDFDAGQLNEFSESFKVLLEEVSDGRANVSEFVSDTSDMCGFDVRKFVKDVISNDNNNI